MKAFFIRNRLTLFFVSWLLINLIQAGISQLQDDEAYYWVYAHFLDWGYYDHPPMIALLIKAGINFFPGALGVRLLPVMMNVGTLIITRKLLFNLNDKRYFVICLSLAVLQLTGFWAVPDIPLVFFTALFFLTYQRFLQRSSGWNTILLGGAAACLLYSKYHGVLVLLFTLVSNPALFKKPRIYFAGLLAFLLFFPHLWWQYGHDWISFKFQLFENKAHPYEVNFTLDYLAGQFFIAGPLAGIIFLISCFKHTPQNELERALKFTAVGFFAFFLLSSLRGQVEANWTAPVIIPLMVLTHHYLQSHSKLEKWLNRLLPLTMVIVLLARMLMVFDLLPVTVVKERFHSWKTWPAELAARTHKLPVVFLNSYQRASMYWYHTGQTTYSLNNYTERRNNYNFWPVEDLLMGKPVYIMDIYDMPAYPDSIQGALWKVGYRLDTSFYSFARVKLVTDSTSYTISDQLNCKVSIHQFPPAQLQFMMQNPKLIIPVKLGIYKGQNWLKDLQLPFTLRDLINQKNISLNLLPALPKGKYSFAFAVGTSTYVYTQNSEKINFYVR